MNHAPMEKSARARWVNLSIPKQLADVIDDAVKSGKLGYRSRADFVIDAVRIRLRDLGYKV